MRTTIFYFTGTGNSLKVAKDIAARLGDAKLVPVAKAVKGSIDLSADRIGIVFPVYMWGMPSLVVEFVKRMKAGSDKYIFAAATYGGWPAGTLLQLAELLNKRGMKLSAGFGVRMPGNYTPMYGARSAGVQHKQFDAASGKVKIISEIVKNGGKHKPEANNFLVNALFSNLFYKVSMPKIHTMDKPFNVLDNCNSCGICHKVCPVENIKLVNRKPVWQGKCEQCLACLQWCPVEAIQYGKKTIGRKRYRHPEIKVNELYSR